MSTVAESPPPSAPVEGELTQSRIFRLYLPLAFSWILMATESPFAVAIISRLADPNVNTAAFQVMMALALWIESPVIDLLSTSTTLAKNRQHYQALSRFVAHILVWVTVAHGVVAMTPVYWVVTLTIMGIPREVAEAARPGLMLMLPWSAFIGWRRYLQGILIRYGSTRLIGRGTLVRLVVMIGLGLLAYAFSSMPGVTIMAVALVGAVAAEAVFIHLASRDTIHNEFGAHKADDTIEPLSMGKLARFHFPLTGTTMVMMLGAPAVSAALARAPDAVRNMAGWQVAQSLIWMMRTVVYALPEVVIALYRDPISARTLFRFCLGVGLATTGLQIVLAITGLDAVIFIQVLGANEELRDAAHIAMVACSLLPLIGALHSYVRGVLTAHHLTVARLWGVLVGMTFLIGMLAAGAAAKVSGAGFAGLALTVGMLAELVVLVAFVRKAKNLAL